MNELVKFDIQFVKHDISEMYCEDGAYTYAEEAEILLEENKKLKEVIKCFHSELLGLIPHDINLAIKCREKLVQITEEITGKPYEA
ncbi:MAG: hypothetical protein OEV44_02850 [Spirochaetota bacterium]|nr:hypothetical protein [Spirochaetota bacterium]